MADRPESILKQLKSVVAASRVLTQRVLRPFPAQFRRRFTRILCEQISRIAPDRPEVYAVDGGAMYLNLAESQMMVRRAIGIYEPEKRALIRQILKPGMTFLDVGANKGDFSLLAASLVGPEGRVIAIEPEARNCADLARNVALNHLANVSMHQLALSDIDGRAALYLGQKSGWHTLKAAQRRRDVGTVEVETERLDSLLEKLAIKHVDVAKIDVEGGEVEVIKGAQESIASSPEIVLLIDLHPQIGADIDALEQMLMQHGMSIFDPAAPAQPLDRIPRVPCDIVAARRPPVG
jgi:FkbM family methyltransferase